MTKNFLYAYMFGTNVQQALSYEEMQPKHEMWQVFGTGQNKHHTYLSKFVHLLHQMVGNPS
jgi:hypothetical protein